MQEAYEGASDRSNLLAELTEAIAQKRLEIEEAGGQHDGSDKLKAIRAASSGLKKEMQIMDVRIEVNRQRMLKIGMTSKNLR
jgi:hypothetical protein